MILKMERIHVEKENADHDRAITNQEKSRL